MDECQPPPKFVLLLNVAKRAGTAGFRGPPAKEDPATASSSRRCAAPS